MTGPSATNVRERSGETADKSWYDGYWWSADGLRLHYRLYGADNADAAPILCIPGLMRNARDFEELAARLAVRGRRVYAIDLRGRGESAYARDAMSYVPLTYVQDLMALLDAQGIERFNVIGTSLGGLCAILLAAMQPGRIMAAVLNDVGPEIDATGGARVRAMVGLGGSQPTWMHAARHVAEINAAIYPRFDVHDWLRLVKRTHRLTAEGRIVADYDKQIAAPFRVPVDTAGQDLWPAFAALADVPLLVLRGAHSDILSRAVAQRMQAAASAMTLVEIADVGHPPTLDEPEAVAAIEALLDCA